MSMEYAPIIIPTLNRFEHLKKCIKSLAANRLADQTVLFIGLDYPPSDKYREGWAKIKEYIETITGFKKVIVLEADRNLTEQGNVELLKQHIRALGYKAYIFTEDDNVFSPNFLEYANWGLTEFENDNSVFAIVGFKRVNVDFLENNVYKYPRYAAWGIATWFKKVDKIDQFKDFTVLSKIVRSWPVSIVFHQRVFSANAILKMLKRNYILEDSLPYLLPKEEQYCIYPKISMVRNEGFDGAGLHNKYSAKAFKMYHLGAIDEDTGFTPHIVGPLYTPKLKEIYGKAYRRPIKERLIASINFLVYKFTGRYFYVK